MSGVLAVVAWLAALNPPRTRLGLPQSEGRVCLAITVPGVTGGVVFLAVVAVTSDGLLDALEITPEMFRIAAGFVLVIVAASMLLAPVPPQEPVAGGMWGALWPVAYPRVVSPETLALAITTGASDGVQAGPLAVAAGALIGLAAIPLGPTSRRVAASVGRLFAVLLVLVAVWLAIQGVREV